MAATTSTASLAPQLPLPSLLLQLLLVSVRIYYIHTRTHARGSVLLGSRARGNSILSAGARNFMVRRVDVTERGG